MAGRNRGMHGHNRRLKPTFLEDRRPRDSWVLSAQNMEIRATTKTQTKPTDDAEMLTCFCANVRGQAKVFCGIWTFIGRQGVRSGQKKRDIGDQLAGNAAAVSEIASPRRNIF